MSQIEQFQHLKIQLEAIQSATNNFSDTSCIGRGGFGGVYKGKLVLSTGETMVALKRLDRAHGQGDSEFWKEIMTLSLYRHKNIISLLGYCDDHGEKILVYEYASKKSLDSYLASNELAWVQRLKICIGAARGLAYIHTPAEGQFRIFHRDIKSSNILLDNNWNAKISDFGFSKFAPANNQFSYLLTNPAGTLGYIDPLYHEMGYLTKESDVYSFGVVLFEVLCGRLCFGNNDLQPLIGLVRESYEHNKIYDLVYSNIKDEMSISSFKLFVDIAYQCLSRDRKERPLMNQIVRALESALDLQEKADAEAAVPRAGILHVNVLRTTDARSINPFDASNYFLLSTGYNGRLVKAEGNEESTLYVERLGLDDLYIYVHRIESVNKHRYVGKAYLKLSKVTPELPQTFDVFVSCRGNYIGDLKIEVLYKPTDIKDAISSVPRAPIGAPKDGGLLVVIIHVAYLPSENFAKTAFVSLLFRGKLSKTVSVTNSVEPKWRQEFTFMLEQPPTDEKLRLEVINNSWTRLIPGNGSLGCVDISLADVVNEKWTNKIYKIEPPFLDDGRVRYNELMVEMHWRTSN